MDSTGWIIVFVLLLIFWLPIVGTTMLFGIVPAMTGGVVGWLLYVLIISAMFAPIAYAGYRVFGDDKKTN